MLFPWGWLFLNHRPKIAVRPSGNGQMQFKKIYSGNSPLNFKP